MSEAELPTAASTGQGSRLDIALAAVWAWFEDYGIIRSLAADAVLARARRNELMLSTPRLLQLLVNGTLKFTDATLVARVLAEGPWDQRQRAQINDVLDAWWYETLHLDVGEHRFNGSGECYVPGSVLGVLAHYSHHTPKPHSVPLGRWLDVWRSALDGPASIHLAKAIVASPQAQEWADNAWQELDDARQQFLAWARTEPILNGLTLVGGTHISLHACLLYTSPSPRDS